ncbi:hypothetical protein Syun_031951 [Stephania yunnanensis]|uniref:Uncharacterized protein n=1 Tax=Stephania yunnanensis TaxID=152371 RepID=A0AAP0HF64_9MAGN
MRLSHRSLLAFFRCSVVKRFDIPDVLKQEFAPYFAGWVWLSTFSRGDGNKRGQLEWKGPIICDQSEEPLPNTILLQPKRFLPVLTAAGDGTTFSRLGANFYLGVPAAEALFAAAGSRTGLPHADPERERAEPLLHPPNSD